MENTNLKTNIKSLILALVLLVGISFATAQGVWNDATNTPGNNSGIFGPITDGPETQEKDGQLITSGIINNSGALVSYANLAVGYDDSVNHDYTSFYNKTPAYLFGDTFFQKNKAPTGNESQLCVNPEGRVKICNSVDFKAVAPVYYTNTNVTSYPTGSGKVTGYVSYKIGTGQSCTTVATTGTDWAGGQTISGTNTNKAVVFNDWGTYDMKITCDGVTYTATIKIGGKIIPTNAGSSTKYTLNLGASRIATIYAIGGGGSGANETGSCVTGFEGSASSIKIGSTNIVNVGSGFGATAGITSGCTPKVGSGGNVITNTLSASSPNGGYSGSNEKGGCSGMPDSNNNLNTCNSGGTVLPYGKGGTGSGVDAKGGGGGSYVVGNYTLPATGTLTTFVGIGGGKGGSTPKGQDGYISITW